MARIGGDEFAVLLPEDDDDEAAASGGRLAGAARRSHSPVPLTVSIGGTTWAGASDDPAAMVRRADSALYEAKRTGRDRVVMGWHSVAIRLPTPLDLAASLTMLVVEPALALAPARSGGSPFFGYLCCFIEPLGQPLERFAAVAELRSFARRDDTHVGRTEV